MPKIFFSILNLCKVLCTFAAPFKIRCTSITGGAFKEVQSLQLKIGVEIVVATPGRLVDLLNRSFLVLSQCVYLVMDEADKMIDLGFEIDLSRILESLPVSNLKPETENLENEEEEYLSNFMTRHRYRQTFMFSATMPPQVERIAKKHLRQPITIYVGSAGKATKSIEQIVYMMSENGKR